MFQTLDLFSGVGGFSLGLERCSSRSGTGGFKTVAFCEIEEFPRKVLKKHWPDVPIYTDVRELNAQRLADDGIIPDVITGGFPCTDLSVAGKQGGIEAERSGLWDELCRLIGDIRPRFAIVENVSNLLAGPSEQRGGWFGQVLGDLAEIVFDAEWHCIPSSYLGGWSRRDRVWILTYPNSGIRPEGESKKPILRQQHISEFTERVSPGWRGRSNIPEPKSIGGHPGLSSRLHAIGNSVSPQIATLIGRAILDVEIQEH